MINRLFWVGMLALVLAFGMTVTGCKDDDGPKNIFDELSLNNTSTNPPNLTGVGLNTSQFTTLRGYSGYQGWASEGGELIVLYSGQTPAGFNTAKTYLKTIFVTTLEEGDNGSLYAFSGRDASNNYCDLLFSAANFTQDGYLFPAGTMAMYFY